MFDLSGSVILVTGASRGIGRAIALDLARSGADVVVHYHVSTAAAETVAKEVRDLGRESLVVSADVKDRAAVARMVASAGEWKGRLDGLVTSAGLYRGDPTPEVGAADWEEIVRADLEGPFRTIQAALPYLSRSDRAAVVTVSSVLGAHAAVGGIPYQMAKAAVEQMTRALSLELAPRIRVNAVAPGFIRTEMNWEAHTDPTYREKVVRATPLGRWGEPEDIAPAVRFLLSRDADWVTGLVLGVDGGIALR